MTKNINFSKLKTELIFIPLGGCGEIGMNINLYHYNGKWIIIDLGLGFASSDLPGIDIILPNIDFIIKTIKKDILGILLTHAHEDHIGAIQYLWPKISCPIYATKFTTMIVKSKFRGSNLMNGLKFIEITSNEGLTLGDFKITFVPITHSIPEMNGILINTKKGKIFHTGDWKFDSEPIIGPVTNETTLKKIGDNGVLALVGDSTNIFFEKHSGSEGVLRKNLEKVFYQNNSGLIVVTTFASNVARLSSLITSAHKIGRKVILQGRSLWNIYEASKKVGYLESSVVLNERDFKKYKRSEILVICTGCQGEKLAMMNKIASEKHPYITLNKDDVVIFSSKIIPGNEKKIHLLFNKLTEMDIKILNETNEFVHVSGHPSKQEVQKMFKLIKPKLAIPVHGEAIHLKEHCKVAKELGNISALKVKNGDVVIISYENSRKIGTVESGHYIVDGKLVLGSKNTVIKERCRLRDNGIFFVLLIIDKKKKYIDKLSVIAPGVFDSNYHKNNLNLIKKHIIKNYASLKIVNENNIRTIIKTSIKAYIKSLLGKDPIIKINVVMVSTND